MLAILLCLLVFAASVWASRRSLVHGLVAVLATGYCYGILRANVISPYSHFIFDSSLAGLYVSQLWVRASAEEKQRSAMLRAWLVALIAWPILVCFMPFQTFLVSMVGLRGNVFFLPLCLFPVRLKSQDWLSLGIAIAALNTLAFGFGAAEYLIGVEPFYPISPVTLIIYASQDVAGYQYFRIPATFVNAHGYAGTMVCTLPLLIGAWCQPDLNRIRRCILFSGLATALIGILMANTRVYVIDAAIVIAAGLLWGKMSARKRLVWCGVIAATIILAFSNDRLQRFTSLSDSDAIEGRIRGSVNRTFFEILGEYPMGNGLGGGGTSIPSFLEGEVKRPIAMESEYARILLEQGVIGFLLWMGFVLWFLTSSFSSAPDKWVIARRLTWYCCAVFLASAMIGTGLLTSIPSTALMFLGMGWVMVRPAGEEKDRALTASRPRQLAYAR
jgi:hypothetical protein